MRYLISIPISACLMATNAPQSTHEADPFAGLPGYEKPAEPWKDVTDAGAQLKCRDKIRQVREARNQPELDRQPAKRGETQRFYAVEHSMEGCSVLVMADDLGDIRLLPDADRPARMLPAH